MRTVQPASGHVAAYEQPHVLCRLSDLHDPGARGFSLQRGGIETRIFIVRCDGLLHGYINRCPHTGVNLDWTADRFFDVSGTLLQCATHGALFRIADGYCIHGPCAGQALEPIAVQVTPAGDIAVRVGAPMPKAAP